MDYKYTTKFISATYQPTSLVNKRYDRQVKGPELSVMIEAAIQEKVLEGYEIFHLEILKSVGKSVLHRGFHSTEGALITFRMIK